MTTSEQIKKYYPILDHGPIGTTKEEYLAWRKEWKRQYAELSQDVRNLKMCRREFQRASRRIESADPKQPWIDRIPERHRQRYTETKAKFECPHFFAPECTLPRLKPVATQMLELLKQAKIEAQKNYLASKSAVVA